MPIKMGNKKDPDAKLASKKSRKSKESAQQKAITKTKTHTKPTTNEAAVKTIATHNSKPEKSSRTICTSSGNNDNNEQRINSLRDVAMPSDADVSKLTADQLSENQKNVVKRSCQALFGHQHLSDADKKQKNLKLKGATNQLQDLMQLVASRKSKLKANNKS